MSLRNPYFDQINADGFVLRLGQGEPAAWEVLVQYVRAQVAYALRSRPAPSDRADLSDECIERVFLIIQEKLDQFRAEGSFSAWVDRVIRWDMADPRLKQTLQAVSRLLDRSSGMDQSCRSRLLVMIGQREPAERALLLAAAQGLPLELGDGQQRGRWYRARRGLLDDPRFQQLLRDLAKAGVRQAVTLLDLYHVWRAAAQPAGEESATLISDLADPGPPLLDRLIEQEHLQMLYMCLEALRLKSPKQAQAIEHRYLYQESHEQIRQALAAEQSATVRQWINRGLEQLRKCISLKLDG